MGRKEEILSKCTGLTINDEDAYIIHTKTENVLKAMDTIADERMISFSNAIAYNYQYLGDGKWERKDFDDTPIIDISIRTTAELLLIFKEENK